MLCKNNCLLRNSEFSQQHLFMDFTSFEDLQVLVFSTMTRLLDIVEDQLDWRGIQYLRLDGSTASAERGELVCRHM